MSATRGADGVRCASFARLLSASLDGELAPRELASLSAHLAGCPRCAARKEALRTQQEALLAQARAVDHVELSRFSAQVMARIARERARPSALERLRARVAAAWELHRGALVAGSGALAAAGLLLGLSLKGPAPVAALPVPPGALAYASIDSLDVAGGGSAVLDLEGHPTTVIWVVEDGAAP